MVEMSPGIMAFDVEAIVQARFLVQLCLELLRSGIMLSPEMVDKLEKAIKLLDYREIDTRAEVRALALGILSCSSKGR